MSPLVLVRAFSVEEFGRLREFLLYAGLLAGLAAFSLPNALLWLMGRDPEHAARHARRISLALAASSISIVAMFLVAHSVHAIVPGDLLAHCALYVLLSVNLDIWEYLWIAQRRAQRAVLYSTGRLVVRVLVIIATALATGSVEQVVLAMIAFEALRFALAALRWRAWLADASAAHESGLTAQQGAQPGVTWRELLAFCIPSGAVIAVSTLNRSLGGIWISESLGPVALALLVIGGYVLAIVAGIRNSVSDVLLPRLTALAHRERERSAEERRLDGLPSWLVLWQRATVLFAVLLLPASLVLWRFADEFVVLLFSERYRDAAPIVRAYCLMLPLASIDAPLVQRALGVTRSMLGVSVITLATNLLGLSWAVPRFGLDGAVGALVLSNAIGTICLVGLASRHAGVGVASLLPLRALAKVTAASALGALGLFGLDWTQRFGTAGPVFGSLAFIAVLAGVLRVLHLEEFAALKWRRHGEGVP